MFESFKILFLMFILYSFIGWCMECIYMLVEYKVLTNRGFFIGPYCPIYGFGAVFMTMLLQKYIDDLPALFLFAMVVCSILEYLTSYLLEKIFHARWWDYSEELFNINGRICLKTMVPFGIFGILLIKYANPFFLNLFGKLSISSFNILFYIIAIIFFSDVIISIYILFNIKKKGKFVRKDGDTSMELSKKVLDTLKTYSYPYRRLLRAFPNIKYIGSKIIDKSKKVKNRIIKDIKNGKENK